MVLVVPFAESFPEAHAGSASVRTQAAITVEMNRIDLGHWGEVGNGTT
jgi:hypothetical protein